MHFAELDSNNMVKRVVVAEPDFIQSGALGDPASFIETTPDRSKRKNYAGIGYTYDTVKDAFIPPKTHKSWKLNTDTCRWEAPIKKPDGSSTTWDEKSKSWKLI